MAKEITRSRHPNWRACACAGRIDRLDDGPGGRRQLLDYKTSSVESLKKRVREPLEDSQLAFYAALLGAGRHAGRCVSGGGRRQGAGGD
jgi:ATP-dependent helicase/nuclease subunit B